MSCSPCLPSSIAELCLPVERAKEKARLPGGASGPLCHAFREIDQRVTALVRTTVLIEAAMRKARKCVVTVRMGVSF